MEFEPRNLLHSLRPLSAVQLSSSLTVDEIAVTIARNALQEHGAAKWQALAAQGHRLRVRVEEQVWFKSREAELQTALEKQLLTPGDISVSVHRPFDPGKTVDLEPWASPAAEQVDDLNQEAIRRLIEYSFTPEDFRRFCQGDQILRPISTKFAPKSNIEDMSGEAVEHCRTRGLFPELLAGIKRARPRPFQGFRDQIYSSAWAGKNEDGESLPDTPVIQLPPEPQTGPSTVEQVRLTFDQGLRYLDARDWANAVDKLDEVLRLDPEHQEAQKLRESAKQQWEKERQEKSIAERAKALHARAKLYVDEENWLDAEGLLRDVVELDPNYADGKQLLAIVRNNLEQQQQQQRKNRELEFNYGQANKHLQAREWERAIWYLQRVLDLDKGYGNAHAELIQASQSQQLDLWYTSAEQAIEAGDWEQAIQLLNLIGFDKADYPDVRQQLDHSERQKKLGRLYHDAQADMDAERWEMAVKRLGEILSIDARYRESDLARRYSLARIAMAKEQWDQALE